MCGFPWLEDLSLAQTEDLMSSAHMLNSSYNQTLRLLLASSNRLKLLDIRGLRGLTASGLDIALFGPPINAHLVKEPKLLHLFWSGVSKCDVLSGCPLGKHARSLGVSTVVVCLCTRARAQLCVGHCPHKPGSWVGTSNGKATVSGPTVEAFSHYKPYGGTQYAFNVVASRDVYAAETSASKTYKRKLLSHP